MRDKMRRSPTEYGPLPAPERIVTGTFAMRQGRVGRAHLREAGIPAARGILALGALLLEAVERRVPAPEVLVQEEVGD